MALQYRNPNESTMDYDTELELIFHKLDGLSFQRFFNELMKYGAHGFCPVRQKLDGGNDGFVRETGTFYQVYAPESVNSASTNIAISKLVDDFDKLAENWHYITKLKKYIFVINEKFKGVDKKLIERIIKLETDRGIKTEILTAIDLQEVFYTLPLETQGRLIAKHSISRASKSAIKIAAEIISTQLPIGRWKSIDEQVPFFAINITDLDLLSNIRSLLFSISFSESEMDLSKELIESINSFVNLFYSNISTEKNGERTWDNSWKQIWPNPNARVHDEALRKWQGNIFDASYKLCATLNKFANHIRQNHLPDFLNHSNYTIVRLTDALTDEYTEYQP